jgi:pimeloyl-ACP methyl ester carboxylesterase
MGYLRFLAAAIRNQSVVFAGVLKPLGAFDLRAVLPRLKVPILVLEGEETNVPLDATKEWAKAPQNARMALVPNAGHATFVDEPQEFVQDIQIFLRGEWPSAARRVVDETHQ